MRNFTHIVPVCPAVYWGPGGLVSTGESAHPAVTSIWVPGVYGEVNAQLSLSHLVVLGLL